MITRVLISPLLAMFLAMLLAMSLTACSGPAYYLQAIAGQWKLLRSRQPVEAVLNDPATSAERVADLQTARQILQFADASLNLPADGSYESYVEVTGDALVWNVVATAEFSLQPRKWCFPVAGCVPYRGYFKAAQAQKSAQKLRDKGMDVFIAPAAAYSSLGWFKDPLPSTLFGGSDARLAAYLFHELAHQRLYIKGDSLFNEGYASFVEETGVQMWLAAHGSDTQITRWQLYTSATQDFARLVNEVRGQLETLYRSDHPEAAMRVRKATTLDQFRQSLEALSRERWQGRNYFVNWLENPVNNARLALHDAYEGSRCAFANLLAQANGDLREFHRLATRHARLEKPARSEWLKQSCPAVAAAENM